MNTDELQLEPYDAFAKATAWTLMKVQGATAMMAAPTPCDGWDVRTLLSHMLETQRYFAAAANGEEATPPRGEPEVLLEDDPTPAFAAVRDRALRAFGDEANLDQQQSLMGIAMADALVHGWDVAAATAQDTLMPDGLPEAALVVIGERLTDDQRGDAFRPAVPVADTASAQDRLLAFTGRNPART